MKKLHMVAFILLIVGGLNWLLVGIWGKDLFVFLGMNMTGAFARLVYVLVGLSAISELSTHKQNCRRCNAGEGI